MLLSFGPLPSVGSTIRPSKLAVTRFAVIFVLPLVNLTIGPNHATLATHPAQLPLSGVDATISKGVPALSIHSIHAELTLERRLVCGSVETISVLLSVNILPLKSGTIKPGLYPPAMLQILLPFASVGTAISMQVGTEAVRHIIRPLALVNIAIQLDKTPSASGSVVLELTLIYAYPLLLNPSASMPFPTKPLSSVERQLPAVLYCCSRSFLEQILCVGLLTFLRDRVRIGHAGAHPTKPRPSGIIPP
mmetsp:Transcript_53321/g.98596  ORF Transcript_53321/g.98596 Transcript_53321/m.98596 type:complete len:248 (+) Transcript_53321:264-1007(+)